MRTDWKSWAKSGHVPILLGRGVRLWDGLEALEEQYDVEAVSTPSGVTHHEIEPGCRIGCPIRIT